MGKTNPSTTFSKEDVKRQVRQRLVKASEDRAYQAKLELTCYKCVRNERKKEWLSFSHSVWEEIIRLLDEFAGIHGVQKIVATCAQTFSLYKPKLGSTDTLENDFSRAVRRIRATSLEEFLKDKPSFGNKKYADDVKDFIICLSISRYNQETRPSWKMVYRELPALLKLQGLTTPNYNTFKLWIRDDPRSKIIDRRIGPTAFRRIYNSSLKFIPPTHASDCWQIDSTRVSSPWWSGDVKKNKFFTVCVIRDVFSRKMVGVGVGEGEDHLLVLRTIRNAILTEGHLPRTIIIDHGPAYKHEVVKNFFENLKKYLGVVIEMTPPNSPELKAHVESTFGFLFNPMPNHIGKSPKSKRLDSRLSPEAHYKLLRAGNRWTKEETADAIWRVINQYNKTSIDGRETPEEMFRNSEKPNSVVVPLELQALLFWRTFKKVLRRGTIEIQYKRNIHRFMVDDKELRLLEGRELMIKIDIDESVGVYDWGIAYLFLNDEFMGTASKIQDVRYDNVDRDEDDHQSIKFIRRANAEFHAHIKAKKAEIKEVVDSRYGNEFDLTNYLLNDKESQNTAQDSFNLDVFREQNGIKKSDQRYAKSAKQIPIEASADLHIIKEPKDETKVLILSRWNMPFDDDTDINV